MNVTARSVRSAAVYARISSDASGEKLGVTRQLEDCRRVAAERGWTVGREYVDNDVSAYSGKSRPAYSEMVDDLKAGVRDAVIVYNLDRLHRRPVELEEFVALCEQVGVREVATVTADIDLGNDDGLFMARIFAAFAAKESGRRSARVRRKLEQNAQAGLPHGPTRPFGYEADKITVRPSEAVIVRDLVSRFIAGESQRSLANWLNEQEVATVSGAQRWQRTTVRQLLRSARIAGLREHQGTVVGKAVWDPIITEAQRDQVLARLAANAASGRRAPRSHLLSGLLRCGKCGAVLASASRGPREQRRRRYVCVAGPDYAGCGRLTVVADALEELITDAVLARLDSPELADAMRGRRPADVAAIAVSDSLAAERDRLEELAGLYASGQVTAREWMAARNPIEVRIRDLERQLAHATDTTALTDLPGTGAALRSQWDSLSFDRRHAIVKTVLDHATIAPGVRGARTLDISRVQPQWRV